MRDIGGEMSPLVHPGDLVIVGQPEQVPLAWYYLPPGLQYANTIGPVSDPRYMNWVDALKHLTDANWSASARSLVASLRPGQQLLFVRPMTEGAQSWQAPWTQHGAPALGPVGQRPGRLTRACKAVAVGPAQLPRRLLRGRQRRPLREGLLISP